jgi:hypothetical protein
VYEVTVMEVMEVMKVMEVIEVMEGYQCVSEKMERRLMV